MLRMFVREISGLLSDSSLNISQQFPNLKTLFLSSNAFRLPGNYVLSTVRTVFRLQQLTHLVLTKLKLPISVLRLFSNLLSLTHLTLRSTTLGGVKSCEVFGKSLAQTQIICLQFIFLRNPSPEMLAVILKHVRIRRFFMSLIVKDFDIFSVFLSRARSRLSSRRTEANPTYFHLNSRDCGFVKHNLNGDEFTEHDDL